MNQPESGLESRNAECRIVNLISLAGHGLKCGQRIISPARETSVSGVSVPFHYRHVRVNCRRGHSNYRLERFRYENLDSATDRLISTTVMAVSTAVGVIPTTDLNVSATIPPRKLVCLSALDDRKSVAVTASDLAKRARSTAKVRKSSTMRSTPVNLFKPLKSQLTGQLRNTERSFEHH
jgi:hypothetical protein